MGRSPCCDKLGLKKGPWTPEEDQKLLAYIEEHGHGNWRALPPKAGLQRCGKSCRLRWTNYLRSDIKRGKFSLQEEQTIIQLHALLGNRWSAIATHLPKRTDNEIKNYWNTHLKKRLAKMGIDPVTHKPKNDALHSSVDGGQQSKSAAKLSHMAQWESARLEAEARLARQSKLRSNSSSLAAHQPLVASPSRSSSDHQNHLLIQGSALKAWHSVWPNTNNSTTSTNVHHHEGIGIVSGVGINDPEGGTHGVGSPTSTLSFSENGPLQSGHMVGPSVGSVIEFMGHGNTTTTNTNESNKSSLGSCDHLRGLIVKEEIRDPSFDNSLSFGFSNGRGDHDEEDDDERDHDHDRGHDDRSFMEGFTELLLNSTTTTTTTTTATTTTTTITCDEKSLGGAETDNGNNNSSNNGRGDYYEDNKNYWNSILNLVNASPPHSPMF